MTCNQVGHAHTTFATFMICFLKQREVSRGLEKAGRGMTSLDREASIGRALSRLLAETDGAHHAEHACNKKEMFHCSHLA